MRNEQIEQTLNRYLDIYFVLKEVYISKIVLKIRCVISKNTKGVELISFFMAYQPL